jgi:lipopolysaccharide export system permease protein
LKERIFYNEFKELVFYVHRVNPDGLLENLFIYDQREKEIPQTIIAKRGWLIPNTRERSLNLRLEDGTIYNSSLGSKSAQTIYFRSYDIFLPLQQAISEQEKREKSETEMYLLELRRKIQQTSRTEKKYYNYQIEYYKKFSLPFSCLILGLIAFPLGLQSRLAGRSWAIVLGAIVFFIYYLFLSLAFSLGERGALEPVIGLWLPNILVGWIGVYLFWVTYREKEIVWLARLKQIVWWLKDRWKKSS